MSIERKEDQDVAVKKRVKRPHKYKVIMLNDDVTTMAFVIAVLIGVFDKEQMEAVSLTQTIHIKGKAIVGLYYLDEAQAKIDQVKQLAQKNNFPLKCELEKN